MNKQMCEHYLNVFNHLAGTKLRLQGRNGYYCIDALVSDTGACVNIFGGATLKECKDFAVSIVTLMNLMKGEE